MIPSRRGFLAGLAAAGCGRPLGAVGPVVRDGHPDAWNPAGILDETRFACGVQTGDALPDAVLVSVRVDEAVTVRFARDTPAGWVEQGAVDGVAVDGVVQVELSGLAPDTTYAVVAFAGDRRSAEATVRTPPTGSRAVRFAATCCFGSAGSPFRSASRVAAQGVDFVVLLGDTIYAGPTVGAWEPHWTAALSTPGLRELLLSASVIATWDDHEVLNDWTWDEVGDAAWDALASYRRALPQRLGPGGTGVWRRLAWGELLDVFVLDTRGERTATDVMSEDQLQWLLDGLADSEARWKLVVNSVPLTDLGGLWADADQTGWRPFPAQRARVLDALRGRTDVIVVTGDVHFGGIAAVGRPGSGDEGTLEVLCGPAGSKISVLDDAVYDDPQFDPIVLQWNTVVFEVDPDQVRIAFEGDDQTVAERVIRRSG